MTGAPTEMPQNGLIQEVEMPGAATLRTSTATFEPSVALPAVATRLLSNGSITQTEFRLGTAEPPAVALLKELLGPSVAVASLATCMWLDGSRFSVGFLALAVIVFVLSERLLSTPELRATADGERELQPTLPRLMFQWGVIFSILLFLMSTLGLTHLIGLGALTGWFFITPAALMASQFRSHPAGALVDHLARAELPPHHHRRHRCRVGTRQTCAERLVQRQIPRLLRFP